MDTKSNLLLYLASKLPDTLEADPLPHRDHHRSSEPPVNPEIVALRQRLHKIREQSLVACRKGDYRAQARLTGEVSSILQKLREAEGLPARDEFA